MHDRPVSSTSSASLPAWPASWTEAAQHSNAPAHASAHGSTSSRELYIAPLPQTALSTDSPPLLDEAESDRRDLALIRHEIERLAAPGTDERRGLLATLNVLQAALFVHDPDADRAVHWMNLPADESAHMARLTAVDHLETVLDALIFPTLVHEVRAAKKKG